MRNTDICNRLKKLFTVIAVCLCISCLHENHSGCSDGLLLKFRYVTPNGLPLNSDVPKTDHVSVFVFDGAGLFVCEKKDSTLLLNEEYTMRLPLYEGKYQFLVWAGLSDSYEITSSIPKQTSIQDFTLRLKQDANNHVLTLPALLYHGQYPTITLSPNKTEEITIGLKRITNTIQVIIHSEASEMQPKVSIEDNNGTYNYLGEMIPDRLLEYFPNYSQSSDDPKSWMADFNVMSLYKESNAQLKINNPENELVYSEKLIQGLLGTNPNVDFNVDHDFIIEITFDSHYVPISILINNWEIIPEVVG